MTVYLSCVLCVPGVLFSKPWQPPPMLCWTTMLVHSILVRAGHSLLSKHEQTKIACSDLASRMVRWLCTEWLPHWSPCLFWEGWFLVIYGGGCLADALFAWLFISRPDWQLLSWIIREGVTSMATPVWLLSDASYSARSLWFLPYFVYWTLALPVPLEHRSRLSSAGFVLWEFHFLGRWTKPSITLVTEILVPLFSWFLLFPDFSSSKNRSRLGNHLDKGGLYQSKS